MLNLFRRERGQDLVEYALVLPIVLVLVLGVVEGALIFFSYNTINDAAREAARWGVIVDADTGYRTAADIENKVYEVTDAAGLNQASVDPVATVNTTGNTVSVVVTYRIDLLNPLALITGSSSITLTAVSTKQIEVE